MISSLFSSFSTGVSGSSVPTPPAAPSTQAAVQTAQVASATPHVAATLNASISRTTIQAILESSQAQKASFKARSVSAAEGVSNTMAKQISRVACKYDEEDDEDETYPSR